MCTFYPKSSNHSSCFPELEFVPGWGTGGQGEVGCVAPFVSTIHYLHSHMPGTVAGGFCFLQSRKRKYLSFSLDFVALSLYPLLLVHPSFYSVIVSGGRREPCIEIAVAAGTCNPELPGSSGPWF